MSQGRGASFGGFISPKPSSGAERRRLSAGTEVLADLGIFDSEGKGRKRSALPRAGVEVFESGSVESIRHSRKGVLYIMESLILAQNERWRRVLSMQVGR